MVPVGLLPYAIALDAEASWRERSPALVPGIAATSASGGASAAGRGGASARGGRTSVTARDPSLTVPSAALRLPR